MLALSTLAGLAALGLCAVLWREPWLSPASAGWAALAGAAGSVGVTALYRALASGQTAMVASTSAVVSAVLPVGFGILTGGLPPATRLAGFALALLGIWLVSRPAQSGHAVAGQFWLACLAGTGFGFFMIFIVQVGPGSTFIPLVVARCVALCVALVLLRVNGRPMPALTSNPAALLAGALDSGGNVLYMLSQRFTRIDVAAVLSSLYPASTVLLAWVLLKERVSRGQWVGVVICLIAIALITV